MSESLSSETFVTLLVFVTIMIKLFTVTLCFFSLNANADSLDENLRKQLEFFSVTPLQTLPKESNPAKLELGRKLFIETNISGNRNISCRTCHHPMMGTSDSLPLSQTEDGRGILKRNSISIFNLGHPNSFMFWDGRVHYNSKTKTFNTPEPSLNGPTPSSAEITSVMTSALAAQAIFPLVSVEEMKGRKGDNEIANSNSNLEAWDKIVKRLTTEGDKERYLQLFKASFPEAKSINIGHVGEAMATFMGQQFQSNTSPFHRYVAGDNSAMTEQQKKGLAVFIGQGKCIACHQGSLLGGNNAFFASVGVPQYGAKPFQVDRGRGDVNNETFKKYFFRTPSLINVGLTAPYMHNGAFKTIREVINHYNNIRHSLMHFEISPERRKEFPVEVEVVNDPIIVKEIWNSIQAQFLKQGLGMTEAEKDDLESFLSTALTDPKWNPRQN